MCSTGSWSEFVPAQNSADTWQFWGTQQVMPNGIGSDVREELPAIGTYARPSLVRWRRACAATPASESAGCRSRRDLERHIVEVFGEDLGVGPA
jgi:hypothetical protein